MPHSPPQIPVVFQANNSLKSLLIGIEQEASASMFDQFPVSPHLVAYDGQSACHRFGNDTACALQQPIGSSVVEAIQVPQKETGIHRLRRQQVDLPSSLELGPQTGSSHNSYFATGTDKPSVQIGISAMMLFRDVTAETTNDKAADLPTVRDSILRGESVEIDEGWLGETGQSRGPLKPLGCVYQFYVVLPAQAELFDSFLELFPEEGIVDKDDPVKIRPTVPAADLEIYPHHHQGSGPGTLRPKGRDSPDGIIRRKLRINCMLAPQGDVALILQLAKEFYRSPFATTRSVPKWVNQVNFSRLFVHGPVMPLR